MYLALTVLAILVGRMVVHGICRGGVGRWAVRLGVGQGRHAGETRQDLQTLGSMTVGGHCAAGLQATGQWGKGKVSLGLMWDSTGVQQAHYLRKRDGGECDQNRVKTEIKNILVQNEPSKPSLQTGSPKFRPQS